MKCADKKRPFVTKQYKGYKPTNKVDDTKEPTTTSSTIISTGYAPSLKKYSSKPLKFNPRYKPSSYKSSSLMSISDYKPRTSKQEALPADNYDQPAYGNDMLYYTENRSNEEPVNSANNQFSHDPNSDYVILK